MKTLREYFEENKHEGVVVQEDGRIYIDIGDMPINEAIAFIKEAHKQINEAKKEDDDNKPDWLKKKTDDDSDDDDKDETKESVEADTYANQSLDELRRLSGMDSITNRASWSEYKPKSD